MRLTGYKVILLVSYIIIVLFNLGTLYQLSYTGTTTEQTEEAQRRLESDETDQTSQARYIINNTETRIV